MPIMSLFLACFLHFNYWSCVGRSPKTSAECAAAAKKANKVLIIIWEGNSD